MLHLELDKLGAMDLWTRFRAAHGDERLELAYRLPGGIGAFPRRGETVWGFFEGVTVAGWGSLTPELWGTSRLLAIGVFPEFERRGIRNVIGREMLKVAFSDPEVSQVTAAVLWENRAMLARMFHETRYHLWEQYGRLWAPEICALFHVTRERYNSVIGGLR